MKAIAIERARVTGFVLDASVAASLFLPDEANAAATALAPQILQGDVLVPDLFWHEMRNLLLSARRSGRLDGEALDLQFSALEDLPLVDAGRGSAATILRLAAAHKLTAYDAAYLAVAIERRLPLASFDRKLRSAATAEGIAVLPQTTPAEA